MNGKLELKSYLFKKKEEKENFLYLSFSAFFIEFINELVSFSSITFNLQILGKLELLTITVLSAL